MCVAASNELPASKTLRSELEFVLPRSACTAWDNAESPGTSSAESLIVCSVLTKFVTATQTPSFVPAESL